MIKAHINRRTFLFLLTIALPPAVYADAVAYGKKEEVIATQGTLKFRHVHDWGTRKPYDLYADHAHHERFFAPVNDFAFVELRDGKKVVFRSPSPALTHLWISPDGEFFVGLSRVKLRNPYQLVVWQRDGKLVHRERISSEVAKLSPEDRKEFAKKFPAAETLLLDRYFDHGGSTYVDYRGKKIGSAGWDYLYAHRARHPYSDDFSESVSNWIDWFDPENPEIGLVRKGAGLVMSLRSPTGKPGLHCD